MRWTPILVLVVAFSIAITGCAGATSAASPGQALATPAASPTPTAQKIGRAFLSAMVLHNDKVRLRPRHHILAE
jgi:hypothetical protein